MSTVLIVDNVASPSRDAAMERYREVMALLRAARALLGLHQEELAKSAGVSRQTIARIENSNGAIPVETVEKVREALERQGVVFHPPTADCGPTIGLRREPRSKA